MRKTLRFKERIRSFKFAIAGIWTVLKSQTNARIHACATVGVVIAGFFFGISASDWCRLVLVIMAVWTAETINTALEFLADAVSRESNPLLGKAKNAATGAVLISAVGAADHTHGSIV